MSIEDKGYGSFIWTPEGTETLENIAIAIIMASYGDASPFGYGLMRAHHTQMTKEMAQRMLNGEDISGDYIGGDNFRKNEVYMDYVFGRCCKTGVKITNNAVEIRISKRDRNPKQIIEKAKKILRGE